VFEIEIATFFPLFFKIKDLIITLIITEEANANENNSFDELMII